MNDVMVTQDYEAAINTANALLGVAAIIIGILACGWYLLTRGRNE